MLAARFHGPGAGLAVEPLEIPRPRPGEVVLRVLACGLCHTDLQFLDGVLSFGVIPVTLGHEIAGEVVDLGEDTLGAAEGDRAVVYYYTPCGECGWCGLGHGHLCPNAGPQIGFSADGGFAEYVAVPARNLLPLPPGLDPAHAATLACSAASAYHALIQVGGLRVGETAVIYGVGGVGLQAVQLARLAGARVIALGRTAAKLRRAAELGADLVVDTTREDPVLAVASATDREGAHLVLDLVGTHSTLDSSLAMLRRGGRLVCLGYAGEALQIDPLRLILKELQVRSAVGSSLEDLRTVLALAAQGRLRPTVAERYPLGEIAHAVDRLRRGAAVGRIVVEPGAGLASSRSRRRPVHELEENLLAFIGRGVDGPRDDREFTALALRLFEYQFRCNAPYRRVCEERGRTPDTVIHWREIPAVPIAAFKYADLVTEPGEEAAAVFRSSGTTRPEQRSRHVHPSLRVYDLNATLNFAAHVLPDGARLPIYVIYPPPEEMPDSSLAYWFALMVRHFGGPGSDWFVRGGVLEAERLAATLQRCAEDGQPVCLLAASFSLVHLLDRWTREGISIHLPPASRLLDTGGYKGRSREIPQGELYGLVTAVLGIPYESIVNMYRMTEHSTQFLDAVLRNHLRGIQAPRYKAVPPWARTLVVDPETLEPLPAGQVGLLLHYDLANRASVLAVLSEDLGRWSGEGFELVGRVQGSEARGCSIALDEFLRR